MALSFRDYQRRAQSTATYPNKTLADAVVYLALGTAGEAGEVADHAKKMLRDDSGRLTAERETKIIYEMGDNLWYIASLAAELGYELEDVAQMNLDKLAARKESDLIHGEGSNR